LQLTLQKSKLLLVFLCYTLFWLSMAIIRITWKIYKPFIITSNSIKTTNKLINLSRLESASLMYHHAKYNACLDKKQKLREHMGWPLMFWWGLAHLFSFLCCVGCFFLLCFCLSACAQCCHWLWIVHSWLSFRFFLRRVLRYQ